MQSITEQKITNSLDKAIHDSPVLQSFNETAQGLVQYNKNFPLEFFTPKAYRFSVMNKESYIVSYEKGEKYPYGPKFIYFDDKPQILTGWCSYPYVRAFILNQEHYFESGSGCCDCGITVMELFKIEAGRVRLIHGDSSESD